MLMLKQMMTKQKQSSSLFVSSSSSYSSSLAAATLLLTTFFSPTKAAFTSLPPTHHKLLRPLSFSLDHNNHNNHNNSHKHKHNIIRTFAKQSTDIDNCNNIMKEEIEEQTKTEEPKSQTKATAVKDQEDDILLLPYEEHTHNSIKIIIPENYNEDNNKEQFKKRLLATIETCIQLQKSSLWITIPMTQARLIETMVDIEGLEFHHASGSNANLCLWLQKEYESRIPDYATHQVGVGAMVINSTNNHILCVRELRNNYRPWKIPGGLAEVGEQLDDAAIREVKEETGIDCRFKSVLTFRHTHGLQFGRSDLYFVCRLEPIEVVDEVTGGMVVPDPVAQEGEIAATAWVPFDEYRAMVNAGDNPHPMMQKVLEVFDEENDIQRSVVTSIVPGRKPSPMYHATPSKKN